MHWEKNSWWLLPLLLIGMPLLGVTVYLYSFAQDRYTSTSLIVVKQVNDKSSVQLDGLGALLGSVASTNTEDAKFLQEYIESPDMLQTLDRQLDFRKAFSGNGSDPFFQLDASVSKEELLNYYRKSVTVDLNSDNSVLTIKTEGFDPEFTLSFNRALLKESERFVNAISQSMATEQLDFSEKQLKEATDRLNESRQALLNYQNTNRTFDPLANAETVSKVIASLQASLAELQTQERTLLSYLNPDTPQVIAIRSQIISVQQQIETEKSKLTSKNGRELNSQAAQFEELKSQAEFGSDLYKLALTSLEKARLEVSRKMKTLVIISSPQLPQEAMYPRRIYVIGSVFLMLCVMYGVLQLTLAVVRDHKD
jgi:capsular polysaccharide transport system permease protein